MERFELTEGTSAKFWQWMVEGCDLIVEYGRIGTKGQASTKSFPSEAAAREAGATLAREKVASGYSAVAAPQSAAVALPEREVTKPVTGSETASVPVAIAVALPAAPGGKPGKTGKAPSAEKAKGKAGSKANPAGAAAAALAGLAKKMAAKNSGWDQFRILIKLVTFRAAYPTLWELAARDVMPPKLLRSQLEILAEDAPHAVPSQIVDVLTRLPTTLEPIGKGWLLDNYPAAVDALLVHAAHRAPAELAAAESRLPTNVRRALPFVRRRLGQDDATPSGRPSDLLSEFVKHHVGGYEKIQIWFLRDGHLVLEDLDERLDRVAELARALGPSEAFAPAIAAAAEASSVRRSHPSWRVEPYCVQAPEARLPEMLVGSTSSPGLQMRMLSRRSDAPEVLVGVLAAVQKLDKERASMVAERVAGVAAVRFIAAGKALPKGLDAHIGFDQGPRYGTPEWATYIEGLRAFPRATILEKVSALVALPGAQSEERARAAVGLAAHWDEALFAKLVDEPETQRFRGPALGQVGPVGLPVLEAALARAPTSAEWEDTQRRNGLREAITFALVTAEAVEPKWDTFLTGIYDYALLLARLPPARRDAVLLAGLEGDRNAFQRGLWHMAMGSDAAVDQAIRLVAKRRNEFAPEGQHELRHFFSDLGARAVAPLRKHFAGKADPASRQILDSSRLSDADFAAITNGAPPLPA